jgi:hypothetical protein
MSSYTNLRLARKLTVVVQLATRGPFDRDQARKVIKGLHEIDKETGQRRIKETLGLVCHAIETNMNLIPEAKAFPATLQEEFQYALARGDLK